MLRIKSSGNHNRLGPEPLLDPPRKIQIQNRFGEFGCATRRVVDIGRRAALGVREARAIRGFVVSIRGCEVSSRQESVSRVCLREPPPAVYSVGGLRGPRRLLMYFRKLISK